MRNLNIAALALVGVVALNSCTAKKAVQTESQNQSESTEQMATQATTTPEKGLEIDLMDKSVRPQDDFYNYVNGGWMKTAKIPADKSSWGSFNILAENTDNNSMKIMHELLKENFAAGSEGKKIQDLYASYIDLDKRNAEGIKPIQSTIAKVDAIKNMKDLQKFMIEETKQGNNVIYGWGVDADMKNSKMNAIYLGDPSDRKSVV